MFQVFGVNLRNKIRAKFPSQPSVRLSTKHSCRSQSILLQLHDSWWSWGANTMIFNCVICIYIYIIYICMYYIISYYNILYNIYYIILYHIIIIIYICIYTKLITSYGWWLILSCESWTICAWHDTVVKKPGCLLASTASIRGSSKHCSSSGLVFFRPVPHCAALAIHIIHQLFGESWRIADFVPSEQNFKWLNESK